MKFLAHVALWWTLATILAACGGATSESAPEVARSSVFSKPLLFRAKSISAGQHHTCAVLADESVACFGDRIESDYPSRVPTESDISDTSTVGFGYGCALRHSSSVSCWGDGPSRKYNKPDEKTGLWMDFELTDVEVLSVGWLHACAIGKDKGDVYCFGNNTSGQLGDATFESRAGPVRVAGLKGVSEVACGWFHTCAVVEGGRVACWGDGSLGQLGPGATAATNTPVMVEGLDRVEDLAAGMGHTCALKKDGTVYCFGLNNRGQLGDGTRNTRAKPELVIYPTASRGPTLTDEDRTLSEP